MAEASAEPLTIAEKSVVAKYKMVAETVNKVLAELIGQCVADAQVVDICAYGDKRLHEETDKIYKKDKTVKKGIAFPTCVSVNNCICHYSPLRSDKSVVLQDGDVVKIDLGAHLDGFPAVVAHTLVVGSSPDKKVTGRKADVILAAYNAIEASLRKLRPGNDNYSVTNVMQKASEQFQCKPIEGMLSHQLIQHRIDGEKAIISNPTDAQRKEHPSSEFEVHEVYAIDVLVSTGQGKAREQDARTTVFKKSDVLYQLKMKASRAFLSEAEKKFYNMPFTLRDFDDENKARMGVVECLSHSVVEPFPVLYEKEGEFVAQFKYTIFIMANGVTRVTGGQLPLNHYSSEHRIQDNEIKALLNESLTIKAKKNNEAAAKAQAEVEAVVKS